jgi:hypothetical protein
VRDDSRCAAGNGQLDEMIVRFIAQIGSPQIVDIHPPSNRRYSSQKLQTLAVACQTRRQARIEECMLVLCQEGWTEEWLVRSRQTTANDPSSRAATGADCRNDNVRVHNDRNHDDSIYAVIFLNNQPMV